MVHEACTLQIQPSRSGCPRAAPKSRMCRFFAVELMGRTMPRQQRDECSRASTNSRGRRGCIRNRNAMKLVRQQSTGPRTHTRARMCRNGSAIAVGGHPISRAAASLRTNRAQGGQNHRFEFPHFAANVDLRRIAGGVWAFSCPTTLVATCTLDRRPR
jgi:hypothetical protein